LLVGVADGRYVIVLLVVVAWICTCVLASVAVTTYTELDAGTVYAGQVERIYGRQVLQGMIVGGEEV
jgi:amino acid permease